MNSVAAAIIEHFDLGMEVRSDGDFYLGGVEESRLVSEFIFSSPGALFWDDEPGFASYPYRVVWINIRDRLVLTYTEGDLRLQVFDPRDFVTFYKSLATAAEFYSKH